LGFPEKFPPENQPDFSTSPETRKKILFSLLSMAKQNYLEEHLQDSFGRSQITLRW
jgi:hypothetical protein